MTKHIFFFIIKGIYLCYVDMKVVFPKHIQKWLLAGMSFSIWPMNLSIIQLFLVAVWVAAWLGIFNTVAKSWSKAIAIMVAIPVMGIFFIIAFFKVSELGLLPFIAKVVRNNFFDVPKKFQTNYEKFNLIELMIQRSKTKEKKQSIEQKVQGNADDLVKQLNTSGLL